MALHPVALEFSGAIVSFLNTHLGLSLPETDDVGLLKETLAQHSLPCFVVALSGGLDSQVLLTCAASLLPRHALKIVHVHHGLHTKADDWALFCGDQAETLGVDFVCERVALKDKSENAARKARYQVLEQHVQRNDILLMGHHLDDQAETVLFRLMRASGPNGLEGVPQARSLGDGCLLRPLLNLPRSLLHSYALQEEVIWVDDPSNMAIDYDRNYLRHEVLPALERRWPSYRQQLLQSAQLMKEANESHQYLLDHQLEACASVNGLKWLDVSQFSSMPKAVQKSLLYRWLELCHVAVTKRLMTQVMDAMIVAGADRLPEIQVSNGVLRRYQKRLYLTASDVSVTPLSLSQCGVGVHDLGDGVLSVSQVSGQRGLRADLPLDLVRRQGGEKMLMPNGQHKTVKKLLQEYKIPVWLRANWPLIMHQNQLVAIPGVGVALNWLSETEGFSVSWQSSSLSDGQCFAIL